MFVETRHALASALALLAVLQPVLAQDVASREELQVEIADRDALIDTLQREVRELKAQLAAVQTPGHAAPSSAPERAPRQSGDDPTQVFADVVAAERALERTLVQSGALLLPHGGIELAPLFAATSSKIDFPIEVDAGGEAQLGATELERTESVLGLTARFGLPGDSQFEIGLPYRSVTEESSISVAGFAPFETQRTARGRGDLTLGIAKTLLRESGRARPDIVARLSWTSGDGASTDDGVVLGGGFESWSGSLSFVKRRDPLALFWSLGYSDARPAGDVDPGSEVSASFGTALAVAPHSSLFGSLAYRSLSASKFADEEMAKTEIDAMTLSLGLSTTLRRGSLLTVYSDIGLSADAPDYSLGFTLPMRLH